MLSKLRKISIVSLAALIVFAPLFTIVPVAHANVFCKTGNATGPATQFSGSSCPAGWDPAPDPGTTPATGGGDSIGCNLSSFIGTGVGITSSICITNVVYAFTVGLGSAFAYVAAFFFDLAIQLSLQSTAYALDFISTGWTLARDIANMAFIFILIYIALVIMFQADTTGTVKTLVLVIVIALLVNFSFFFTRVVIDAGNLIAIQFYNAIPAPPISQTVADSSIGNATTLPSSITAFASGGQTKDLTYSIVSMLQLQNLFSTAGFQQYTKSDNAGFLTGLISLSFLYIAAGIIYWGLIAVFISTGVKLLMRIVILWFLIIASPLAFVARAIPTKLSGLYDQWQEMLIKNAFYPVVFMFVFFILTKFTCQMGGGTVGANGVCNMNGNGALINGIFNSISGSPGYVQAMAIAIANTSIRLGFVIAVLYIGIRASESLGVMGANAARTAGGWFAGRFVATAAGTSGYLLRQSVGRGFNRLSKSTQLNEDAQRSVSSRVALRATKWLGSSATFDVRNAPGAGLVKKAIEKSTGISPVAGKAPSKGFAENAKEIGERREKERKERAAIIRDAANKKAIAKIAEGMKATGTAASTDEDRVHNFNKREIEALKAKDIEGIAHLLNESQLKAITDSDKYTDAEKDNIKKIAEPIIKSQKEVADNLRKASNALRTSATAVVQTHTTKGAQITLADIAAMHADVNNQKAAVRTYIQANPGQNHGERNADLTQLHNMTTSLNELARQVAKIQPVGSRPGQVHYVS